MFVLITALTVIMFDIVLPCEIVKLLGLAYEDESQSPDNVYDIV